MSEGHDPLANLRARVDDAIVDLSRLRSSDPAARSAMDAVRLAQLTLECFWEPAVAPATKPERVDPS